MKKKFRVASLNIAHGRGLNAHQLFINQNIINKNLSKIKNFLKENDLDIVALQEVDFYSFWTGFTNQLELLANECSYMNTAAGIHMNRYNLLYGTGLLSKEPIESTKTVTFPSYNILPPKGFTKTDVKLGCNKNKKICIISLHLDFAMSRNRLLQIQILINFLSHINSPIIIMGDFNSEWKDKKSAVRLLCNALNLKTHELKGETLVTFPPRKKCWDWILYSKHFNLKKYYISNSNLSDHKPVIAELELKEEIV